ncbi:lycopene cyclase family protein [Runella salmonicolor]|uniref:Lycopene cyclase family protein n=1 Tax=Runella salmonicolor TaxID=2950278 RepID=A0ABT1FU59_9BACT|nr:lycopene cyclase family protein [Runella salmonicolor]MCP1385296.1 lycopene cyclase family protein [Runella salmonicolor]
MTSPSLISTDTLAFFDYTIVGAGASGLWLALSLFEQGLLNTKHLCIVESDSTKHNDRTWCYWSTSPLTPNQMISQSWSSIFNPHDLSQRNDLSPYSYHHVRSADFYASIRQQLAGCANIVWRTMTVVEIDDTGAKVRIKTTDDTWWSSRVFMSAMPGQPNGELGSSNPLSVFLGNQERKKNRLFLWQTFVGWRVRTVEPVFDETCATLMRFDIAQNGSTQFMYELPFSSTEALVEITRFGEFRLTRDEADAALSDYMLKKNINYQILEEEEGAIPMTPQFDMQRKYLSAQTRLIYLGTLGGAIKPTTGYGFRRMQAYAKALATALKQQKPLPTMRRAQRFRFYDHLLLQILARYPNRGKAVFQRLFETQPVPRILRFLDEETNLWEEMLIFIRLPIRLFLRSLTSYYFNL